MICKDNRAVARSCFSSPPTFHLFSHPGVFAVAQCAIKTHHVVWVYWLMSAPQGDGWALRVGVLISSSSGLVREEAGLEEKGCGLRQPLGGLRLTASSQQSRVFPLPQQRPFCVSLTSTVNILLLIPLHSHKQKFRYLICVRLCSVTLQLCQYLTTVKCVRVDKVV